MLAVVLSAAAAVLSPSLSGNMNEDVTYGIANPASKNYSAGFRGKWFEIESPLITSRYSQVYWKGLGVVSLPEDVIQRYDGKVMAITGFEVDVFRNTSSGPQRVPCYESYNHHYAMALHGAGVDIEYVEDWSPAQNTHGGPHYLSKPNGRGAGSTFTAQAMNEHNGNEARQTYHGLPNGFVIPLESPRSWTMSPMQINTRNPAGTGKRCNGDCPLPRRQNAPKGAAWSGILECPCTTRSVKSFDYDMRTTDDAGCTFNSSITTAKECFAAAVAHLTPAPAPEVWTCSVCHHVYDPAKDDPAKKNTPFEQLPATWKCPVCGAPKSAYKKSLNGEWVHEHSAEEEAAATSLAPAPAPETWTCSVCKHVYDPAKDDPAKKNTPFEQLPATWKCPVCGAPKSAYKKSLNGEWVHEHSAEESHNVTVHDPRKPAGCYVEGNNAVFNTASSGANCSSLAEAPGGCICRATTGYITHNGQSKRRFSPGCLGEPKSDLIKTHNPTCDINQYDGGLQCCADGYSLLDHDQEIPELVDNVYFKLRWYYEDYDPTVMVPTYHLEWQFGHIEYSVPKALPGTPPQDAVHTLETRFTVLDFLQMGNDNAGGYGWDLSNSSRKIAFVMLGFHCHSPACLGGKLYNADTGELICHVQPALGRSTVAHDEEDYIWLPPCQFGRAADGLMPPPVLSFDTNLTSVKWTNSSVAHSGVMAIWQGRGSYADEIPQMS